MYNYNWKKEVCNLENREDISSTYKDIVYNAIAEIMAEQAMSDEYGGYDDINECYNDCRYDVVDCVHCFRKDSFLATLLKIWHGDAFADKIRCLYQDSTHYYFFAGCGYDIYDADLLGGSGDGRCQKRFERWVDDVIEGIKAPN